MRLLRPTAGVLAGALVLICLLLAGCVPPTETARDGSASGAEGTEGRPEGKTLSVSTPAHDVRGEPIPGLPRFPDSVRVGYSEKEAEGLGLIRAAYLTGTGPDAVRGFYRGVFRAGGWQVANVEYSGDVWHFLVLSGSREAWVEVLPREEGSKVRIELSGPAGALQESRASAGGSKR